MFFFELDLSIFFGLIFGLGTIYVSRNNRMFFRIKMAPLTLIWIGTVNIFIKKKKWLKKGIYKNSNIFYIIPDRQSETIVCQFSLFLKCLVILPFDMYWQCPFSAQLHRKLGRYSDIRAPTKHMQTETVSDTHNKR